MTYVGIRGHRAFYKRMGSSGPRILLVMGFGMSGALTNGVMRDLGDLAPDFTVVAGSIGQNVIGTCYNRPGELIIP